jgi:DNA-binding NtrC family response regulator
MYTKVWHHYCLLYRKRDEELSLEKKNLKILLVDNDDQCLQAYKIALNPGNYTCTTEQDPELALEMYKNAYNSKRKIDVIITDLLMPGMSGIELLRRIRKIDKTAKIIIVTAFPDSLILKADAVKDTYAIFPKPLHLTSLISVLNKIENEKQENNGD